MVKEILIVTISMGNDGAERVLSELSREWIRQGNKVVIIQTGAGNYGVSYELDKNIEIVNIKAKSEFKPLRYIQEIKEIIKIFKQRPNATIVSFIASSIFLCGVASLFVKNRLVVSERNNPKECPAGRIQQRLRDWAFSMADVCVFQTEYAMHMFPKKVQKKGVIIPNPINGKLPERYIGERRKNIVAACRLHPQKNLPMLIEAFSLLHKDYSEYKLEIYGQGSEKDNLLQQIKRLGLDNVVVLPGFSNDIHSIMLDSAMYVSSSNYEGISNSMLEALGMGVPTIVTDCPVGGARMVIEDGKNGLLVPVGGTEELYLAMKKIIEDQELSERMSIEATKVLEEYPIEKISKRWIEVF